MAKAHINETNLLLEAAEGNERSFTELFYWYYKPLGRFVFKMTDSQEITEEIVQDAFVKIWLRRETLKHIDSFGAYMFAICRNETFAAMKKIAAEKVFRTDFEKYLTVEGEIDLLDNPTEEYRAMIIAAVAKLPAQQQKVYAMSRYDRLKYEEIATHLGITVVTVKKHIQLAVQFIHKDIASKRLNAGLILVLTTPLILR
ncbi:RNA polymerase sigma factor [Pedobacter hiemivivus]|uniref:RNA polymerase sigma-70 factor n=1 Tax=Pedobacter hiemivivus TaxID=2530454 RepID=A0A4R0MRP9_9SPHI|nr:RNA polymerase sigma-70 factor [Pedobacter hiemivivus]TCC89598.1 RNA polymerase sigma-70 factor [Pedobacter hiemivivus]